jgi:hypothetical protein
MINCKKVKLSLCVIYEATRHEDVWGSRVLLHHSCPRHWIEVVRFMPQPFSPRYPMYRRQGEPQLRSGRYKERNILPLLGTQLVDRRCTNWATPSRGIRMVR